MDTLTAQPDWMKGLNEQQRAAAGYGSGPLLIIAGAGTGKTNALAHRVAHLLREGIAPSRLLLLTFSRRAAAEMARRVESILATHSSNPSRGHSTASSVDHTVATQTDHATVTTSGPVITTRIGRAGPAQITAAAASQIWSGTFHAVAHRILRAHAAALGLAETFTVIDRSDAEDLLNAVRSELGLDRGESRFPRKGTCLAIYSRCVNAQEAIEPVLKAHFPWCADYAEPLKNLFRAYTQQKQEQNTLDYDDLLLYWYHLMQDESLAADVRARFDAVLVDEYQDTNLLQAAILKGLRPTGDGLTVVGDDAQSIYSFRAATVHNILDFPKSFPGAAVLKLEQNYRSVQPILHATNAVIAQCGHRYNKDLFSQRQSEQKPRLVTLPDEAQQSQYLVGRILQHLEAGIPLKKQAVLFRTAHHSDALEVELARRNIPFVKFGGLKFLEAGHVKDALSFLRLAENPRDAIGAFRVLQLIDGIGPAVAKRAIAHLAAASYDVRRWADFPAPAAAAQQWPAFVSLLEVLAGNRLPLPEQVAKVKEFYLPILERRYDQAEMRKRDLDQLEQISAGFRSRSQMLADLTLDPPASTQDLAGPPLLDEDYLILSTIHSAKGCEWNCVYVLHAADGNIPSDMSTGNDEQIEEERRLFYVALTRAKDFLEVCFPLRYYHAKSRFTDRHTMAQLTRFLPDSILDRFERVTIGRPAGVEVTTSQVKPITDVRKKIAGLWG